MILSSAAALCLTMAVYFEARSEPEEGQRQVVHVIMNRVQHPAWPNDVCSVVKQPKAFSFYWDGKPEIARERKAWRNAQRVVKEALMHPYENMGATYYHASYVNPWWKNKKIRLGQIGTHIFYARKRDVQER